MESIMKHLLVMSPVSSYTGHEPNKQPFLDVDLDLLDDNPLENHYLIILFHKIVR